MGVHVVPHWTLLMDVLTWHHPHCEGGGFTAEASNSQMKLT